MEEEPCMIIAQKDPKPVERVTALRGQAIARPPVSLKKRRGPDADHEFLRDSEIPYGEMEKALARVFCALVDRQNRANQALLLRLNDLEYRMDDLEGSMRDLEMSNRKAG
jgi:hypothetical protein